jgi:ATP-dependent RNA helicase HelY
MSTSSQAVFREELNRDAANGRIALVLGTGVSAATTANSVPQATWLGLLSDAVQFLGSLNQKPVTHFLEMLRGEPSTADVLAVAQWVKSSFDPGEYASWLERSVGHLPVTDDKLLNALPDVEHILTTNYDTLWEARFRQRKPITWTEPNSTTRYSRSAREFVYHLHGIYSNPESVILSGTDYGRLSERDTVPTLLKHISTSHSMLLLGYGQGLDDPNFGPLMDWLASTQATATHRHYLLLKSDQLPLIDVMQKLKSRLTPIVYGSAFDELPEFLRQVTWPARNEQNSFVLLKKTSSKPEPPTEETLPSAHEVENELIRAGMPSALVTFMQSESQLGPFSELSDFQKSALLTLINLVELGEPALFFTVTGTGKTTLARVAMNLAVARESAAMAILPTKALVTQERVVWRRWAETWLGLTERSILVYAASRDYPEADRPVSRGRYDIAVGIYEKLALYLITGHEPLSNASVIVIDELQILMENSERAAKLEALLTMLRLLPQEDRPTILGLSPSLRLESSRALQKWLGVPEKSVIQTNERPIPLDAIVLSPLDQIHQPDAHLLGMAGRTAPPQSALIRHDLAERVKERSSILADRLHKSTSAQLAAVLVDKLLKDDDDRKIICFVPTRAGAEALAAAIQGLLKKRMGRAQKGSPWIYGRFSSPGSRAGDSSRYEKLKYSSLPSTDDVICGLREGVAAHSATYPSVLRRLIEDEFGREDGLLRVIVATDTLAMGINLPADTVIATSIFGYSGEPRSKRILSAENLANKAGRAGRRGETSRERGEFYIIVPSRRDIEGIHGLGNSDVTRLSTVEGVLETYVTAPKSPPLIVSHYRTKKDIASLVLQVLCQDRHGRTYENTLERIVDVLEGMLLRHEPDAPTWEPAEVLAELTQRNLVGVRPKDGLYCLSGLGMALGTSSMDLDLAPTLERIARLSTSNAGRIDLLWNACRSFAIQSSTPWVSLPHVHSRHLPSMRDAVLQMATAYCATSLEQRQLCAKSLPSKYSIPQEFVEQGSDVVSAELSELLQKDGEHATDVDVTALLRALVINEWSRGIPFNEIKARFTSSIVTAEQLNRDETVELRLYYADVEQLCDQVAGVLRGAASLAVGNDGLDYSTAVGSLASEVEMGAPSWLTPLLRMRLPSLHRERLAFLWNSQPPEALTEVLTHPKIVEDLGADKEDLDEALRLLELRAAEEQAMRHRVGRKWSKVRVPGGEGDSFEDVSEELTESTSSVDYTTILGELLRNLTVDISDVESSGFFSSIRWSSEKLEVHAFVPHGDITGEMVDEIRNRPGLLVARTRLTESGRNALRTPHVIRVVEPEHLLTILARLVETRGAGVLAEEILEALSEIQISSVDNENWPVYDGALRTPPPWAGALPSLDQDMKVSAVDEESAE